MFKAGHSIHEDEPEKTAKSCYDLLKLFKIPKDLDENAKLKELGVGKYKPELPDFN